MELRQEGISDNQIRASEAAIRANAHESTLRSLKELILLAKIAEAEKIEVDEEDFEIEIESMAERTGESPRRIRSRLEKEGLTAAAHLPDPRAEGHRPHPPGQHGGRRRHGRGRAGRGGRDPGPAAAAEAETPETGEDEGGATDEPRAAAAEATGPDVPAPAES